MKWKIWTFDDEGRAPVSQGTWELDEAIDRAVAWVVAAGGGLSEEADEVRADLSRVGGRVYEGHYLTVALVSVE